jgi:hypothetical protein
MEVLRMMNDLKNSTGIILTIVCGVAFSAVIILWVEGIDYMKKNHPDYKGEDLFNEEDKEKKKMIEDTKGHSTRHKPKEYPLTNIKTMKNYVVGILDLSAYDLT